MRARTSLVRAGIGLVLMATTACRQPAPSAEPTPSASQIPVVPSAASSVAPAGAAPRGASAGTWSGTYRAAHYLVQMDKKEALPAWAKDEQKLGVGQGRLELVIDPNGSVSGTSTGPLGQLQIFGRLEDGTVRATVSPDEPTTEAAFHGFFVAELQAGRMKGELQVSTGDGAIVRRAPFELGRRP